MLVNDEKKDSRLEIKLTQREKECLYWASQGKTAEETALLLGISTRTIYSYLVKVRAKLNTSKITSAVCIAIKKGWI